MLADSRLSRSMCGKAPLFRTVAINHTAGRRSLTAIRIEEPVPCPTLSHEIVGTAKLLTPRDLSQFRQSLSHELCGTRNCPFLLPLAGFPQAFCEFFAK